MAGRLVSRVFRPRIGLSSVQLHSPWSFTVLHGRSQCRLDIIRHASCCPHEQKQKELHLHTHSAKPVLRLTSTAFWASTPTWKRASVNTLRCLVGCSAGDFTAMWILQAHFAHLGMWPIMAISITSGLASSVALETVLLRLGRDKLTWLRAARTAVGMSLISMITMEITENAVDYYLTGGTVALGDPLFWTAAAVSMAAGFIAPLPYNYVRLRRFGKACH